MTREWDKEKNLSPRQESGARSVILDNMKTLNGMENGTHSGFVV